MSGYNVGIGRDGMKSPAKNTDGFNDTYMGNGPVPKVPLVTGDPGTRDLPRSVGRPRGVVEADGTANLRAETQTKQGSTPKSPSGKATNKYPAGVDQFGDGGKV